MCTSELNLPRLCDQCKLQRKPVLKQLGPQLNIPCFWILFILSNINILSFPGKCWTLKRYVQPGWCSSVIKPPLKDQLGWLSGFYQSLHKTVVSLGWVLLHIGASVCVRFQSWSREKYPEWKKINIDDKYWSREYFDTVVQSPTYLTERVQKLHSETLAACRNKYTCKISGILVHHTCS